MQSVPYRSGAPHALNPRPVVKISRSPPAHGMICCVGGRKFAHARGCDMEFEATRNRKAQLMALMMTVVVVGGAIAYAMTA